MPAVVHLPAPAPTPEPKVGNNLGGKFVPGSGFVPNKPTVIAPPNQAPYKPGRSPAQVQTAAGVAAGQINEKHVQASATTQAVQRMLNAHGAHLTVDGQWGPATESAYQAYLQSARQQAKVATSLGPQQLAPQMVTPKTVATQVNFEKTAQGKAQVYLGQLRQRGFREQGLETAGQIQKDLNAGLITPQVAETAYGQMPKPTAGYFNRIPNELKQFTLGQAEGVGAIAGRDILAPAAAMVESQLPGYTRGNQAQEAQTLKQNTGDIRSDVINQGVGIAQMPLQAAMHPLRNPVADVASVLMLLDPLSRLAEAHGGAALDFTNQEVADAGMMAARNPINTPVKSEIEAAHMAARNIPQEQIPALMHSYDTAAYLVAKAHGITPERALSEIWDGAEHVPTSGVPDSYSQSARLNEVGQDPNARAAVLRNPRPGEQPPTHTLVLTNRATSASSLHELMHAIEPHLPTQIRDQFKAAYDASGAQAAGQNYDEFVARNFEAWMSEGKAPVPGLQATFDELAPEIQQVYAKSEGVPPTSALTDDMRNVFNEMYARARQDSDRSKLATGAAAPRTLTDETIPPENLNDLKNAGRRIFRAHAGALPDGIDTPGKVTGLLRDLRQRAVQGAGFRKWYAESAHAILDHVGHNVEEAKKLAALLAVYSPRAEVYSPSTDWNNLGRALNAYNEFKETGQIGNKWSISSHLEGEGDWQTTRANAIMNGTFDWQGLKTNRFFRNFLMHISPEEYKATYKDEPLTTTQDTWMRRAFNYPKQRGGAAQVDEGISPKMYAAMDHATTEVGKSLGWSPEEAQAAIWTSIKSETEKTDLGAAGMSFKQAFESRPNDLLQQAKQKAWNEIAAMAGEKLPQNGNVKSARSLGKAEQWLRWTLRNDPTPHLQNLAETIDRATQVADSMGDADLDRLFGPDPLTSSIADAQGKTLLDEAPETPEQEARRKSMEAAQGEDLQGIPKGSHSNAEAQDLARQYMAKSGLKYEPPTQYAKVDKARAAKIAEWYDKAQDSPNDPKVRAAYNAMARETLAQYHQIVAGGYTFEFYPEGHDPYPVSPSQAIDDLRENKHMYVYPTEKGFGTMTEAQQAHPLLGDSGVKWNGQTVTHNDIFRAVHDFFGHYKEGNTFRSFGEENAWRSHSAMYSETARPAMTAETRGQNSWLNYGPHGEANRTASTADTVFADQKAVLAPDWVVNHGSGAPGDPDMMTPEEIVASKLPAERAARRQQDKSDSAARGERINKVRDIWQDPNLTPDEKQAKALEAMRGALPVIDYKGHDELTPEAVTSLLHGVQQHQGLTDFQKLTLGKALTRFGTPGERPLTPSELALMQHVWGKATADGLAAFEKEDPTWKDYTLAAINIPRTLMASFDFSFPLRQGLTVAVRHPAIFGRNFMQMFPAWKSPAAVEALDHRIMTSPNMPLYQAMKLKVFDHEEVFQHMNLGEKITGGERGPVARADRAYTIAGRGMRVDIADYLINRAHDAGIDFGSEEGKKFLDSAGNYINTTTGSGVGGEKFEDAAGLLNGLFFSPRLMKSRMNFLNPHWYATLDPLVRQEALRTIFGLAGTASVIVGLASQVPGVSVVTDPRNPDWGKIKFSNGTRIDIGGGFQQFLRLAAQIATHTKISSTTGLTSPLNATGFGKQSDLDIFLSFMEGKEAPIPGLITDAARGQNSSTGQPFGILTGNTKGLASEVVNHITPLIGQDMWDIYNHPIGGGKGGLNGIAQAFGGYGVETFGLGLQTYQPKTKSVASFKTDAEKAGLPTPPPEVLQSEVNESKISSFEAGQKPKTALKAIAKWYTHMTGRDISSYVDAVEQNGTEGDATTMIIQIRGQMVSPQLAQYKAAISRWKKEQK